MLYIEFVIDHHYGGLNPMQFGYENCKPSHYYGPAIRTHWLLHYVVSGFGTFHYQGKIYQIHPGEIFVIPPWIETYYEADAENPWNYIWIGFTTKEKLPEILSQPVFSCPNAMEIFEKMKQCSRMQNGRSAFLASCLWELMAALLDQNEPNHDFIDEAISYMHSQYTGAISINKLAKQLNIDRSYFSNAFTKRVGASPQAYLVNLRMTKAAELMVKHNLTPSVAACSVGYSDLQHFSNTFKKHFGMSPRAYIKYNKQTHD